MEFDRIATPTEFTMVRYFEKGLKPSIKAEIDQDNFQLLNYEELVAKAVRTKAKAGVRPSSYVQKTDLHCLWGNRPAYTTTHKVQMSGAVNRGDDFKASKAPASTQKSEPSDKARKNKKKKQYKDKRDSWEFRDSTTLAIVVNAKASRSGRRRRIQKDISGSHITTVTKRDTTQTNVQNLGGQKTSISLEGLHVNDWC